MSLEQEIEKAERRISADAYEMSVGEITNMYRDGEVIINPDFQRLFRWNLSQKSRFIESLLLRIPIPPIFVFETDEGRWELIDGLQRVSTILEFQGLLRSPDDGSPLPASELVATAYLQSLDGVRWEASGGEKTPALTKTQQLAIKRARIGVQILRRGSDQESKFDLFQRLNSGGSIAEPQELRNCAMVMADKTFFDLIKFLANSEPFRSMIQQTENALEKQADMELATRFIVYLYVPYNTRKDVQVYLDDGVLRLISEGKNDARIRSVFLDTFAIIFESLGTDAFKRFDGKKFKGRFGLTAFESIAVGVASNLLEIKQLKNSTKFIADRVKAMWSEADIDKYSRPGVRGTQRLQKTLPFGRNWFKP